VADAAAVSGETIHNLPFEITFDNVLAALKTADALGRAYLTSKQIC